MNNNNPYETPISSFVPQNQLVKKALGIVICAIALSVLSFVVGLLSSLAFNISNWTLANPMLFSFLPSFIVLSLAFAFVGTRVRQGRFLYLFYVAVLFSLIGSLTAYILYGASFLNLI